jgi:glutamate-ammonia-ligase adenylyltransferase
MPPIPVTDDAETQVKYEAIRQRILCLPRNELELKQEVREMREKMRDTLDSISIS